MLTSQSPAKAHSLSNLKLKHSRDRYGMIIPTMPYKNKEDLYRNQEKYRQKNKKNLWAFLINQQCADCGNNDPLVLQFDHVRGEKKFDIARAMSGSTRSWATIQKEIDKCEIRCANCHFKITAIRAGGWWRNEMLALVD